MHAVCLVCCLASMQATFMMTAALSCFTFCPFPVCGHRLSVLYMPCDLWLLVSSAFASQQEAAAVMHQLCKKELRLGYVRLFVAAGQFSVRKPESTFPYPVMHQSPWTILKPARKAACCQSVSENSLPTGCKATCWWCRGAICHASVPGQYPMVSCLLQSVPQTSMPRRRGTMYVLPSPLLCLCKFKLDAPVDVTLLGVSSRLNVTCSVCSIPICIA